MCRHRHKPHRMCNFHFLEAVKTTIKTKLLLPTLTDNQVFWTGFMYNLVPRLSLEKVGGMYLTPTGKGKIYISTKKSLRILQIVKFGTEEVDEGKIYTLNK